MAVNKRGMGSWLTMASKGTGTVLGPILLGWFVGGWMDRSLELSKPWSRISLLILGALTGLYGLIKMAMTNDHE